MTTTSRNLRLPEGCKARGFGNAPVYELQAEGRFSASVNITEQAVGRIEHAVQAWLAKRIAQSRAQPDTNVGAPILGRTRQRARQRGR
jgi:predicted DNA-binding transcriptional regulator AlpA